MRTRALCMAVIVPFAVFAFATRALVAPTVSPSRTGVEQAALVVNTTSSSDDGSCSVQHCSLAEAINAANANPGPDTISFDIPPGDPGCGAGGLCTIRPTQDLPHLSGAQTTINGFSQPGAHPNTNPVGQGLNAVYKIVLDGTDVPYFPDALDIRSSGNLVRGLVIQHYNTGIFVADSDNNRIEGNFIGTNAQGTGAAGNSCSGISVSGVQGGRGSWDNVVGGATPQARNLISGNGCAGVEICSGGGNMVQGNIVGADAGGTLPLPNNVDGVYVCNVSNDNRIGGQAAGEANLIAFNGGYGVEISGGYGASGNSILHNGIHDNAEGGIGLLNGGNGSLPAPVITFSSGSTVSGTACAACTVEVFSDEDGQGALYEGTTAAGSDGRWGFEKPSGVAGPNVTATATDGAGNTSEFSAPARVLAQKVYVPAVLK